MAKTRREAVSGLRELGKALKKLDREVSTRIARRATGRAATPIREQAETNIVSSPSVVTGELRDNVIVKRVTDTDLTSEHIVTVRKRKAPHGVFVEFGTVKMPAEPFLGPAFDSRGSDALRTMTDTLRDGIEDVSR